jgi:hypothetical protein
VNTTRKGSRYRKATQDFLTAIGYVTRFRPWMEKGDDITAEGDWHTLSVEAKDHKSITLSAFIDQAEANAGPHEIPLVVVKRRGKSDVEDHYFVMTGRAFKRLVQSAPKED